jgi:hypothetical protein
MSERFVARWDPLELKRGDRVRVRGRYRARHVRITLDREPVEVDASTTSGPSVLLCGYERLEGPSGNSRRFHARFVEPGELVEVVDR